MSDFKARKKMLVTESEVYRELLKLEIQTLKVYGIRTKRRLSFFSTYTPWLLMSGLPILSGLFKRKRKNSPLERLSLLFLAGWKAYRQFAPILNRILGRQSVEPTETAAEEYLSKRL